MSDSTSPRGPLRSSVMTKGVDRATHRSLLYSMGWRSEHLDKPLVAVVNSFNELMPGHVHLNGLCQAIKLGIAEAGGTPLEFPTIAVCDGLATGHKGMRMPMPSRELIADSIEIMITAHAFDAMVLLTNCDKITPGMLMAAARLNIPSLVISGGPMDTGCHQGKRVCYNDLMEAEGKVERGLDDRAGAVRVRGSRRVGTGGLRHDGHGQHHEHPGRGAGHDPDRQRPHACDLRRPGGACPPGRAQDHGAARPEHPAARHPDPGRLRNALAVDMAVGGSTNTCLHLPAIASEAGLELGLPDFSRAAAEVPHLVLFKPAGCHFPLDFYNAGGVAGPDERSSWNTG